METFILAGGCYWCLDAAYRTLRGVTAVESGFIGGSTTAPTYEQVCTGTTGHAEAVKVTFDPQIIPADVILDAYFTMHDPRQLNRQGHDVGTQYRSAMFPANDEQKKLFETARERAAEIWGTQPVTTIEPATEFYPGPAEHQDFFANNPEQPYCLAVALPKVNKVRAAFSQYIR
ncbi:peptide-methionine (S)-S-oxide reductase MsrA [Microbacterium sp. YY-01]|uniref:peptide-methionine (S)-S-oxide reductase MsrA n=1 Tax=Microbacterium sp. YY-01 TaxID=3421634 RepID=UPI003D182DF7